MRIHPRRGINEPATNKCNAVIGKGLLARYSPRQCTRRGTFDHALQIATVELLAAGLVEFRSGPAHAVSVNIGQAVWRVRIGPPIGRGMPVVLPVTARRAASLVED